MTVRGQRAMLGAVVGRQFNVAPSGLIVSDAFTRTNSTSLGTADTGQTYTTHTGTCGTNGTQAFASGSRGLATVDFGDVDYDVRCDLTLSATRYEMGIACRLVDGNNLMLVRLRSASSLIEIYKCISGSFTQLASTSGSYGGTTQTLRVVASGLTYQVYVGATLKITYTMGFSADAETLGKATRAGINSFIGAVDDDGTSRFDNFKAYVA